MPTWRRGSRRRQVSDFNAAIQRDARRASLYVARGNAYRTLGRYQNALDDYNKAAALDSRMAPSTYAERGLAYLALNQPERAAEDFSQALSMDPNNAAALRNRGTALRTTGKLEAAVKDYDRVLGVGSRRWRGLSGPWADDAVPRSSGRGGV